MARSRIAHLTLVASAALAAIAFTASSWRSADARTLFCSIDPWGSYAIAGTTLFIATATSDSLPGGNPKRGWSALTRDSIVIAAPAFTQVVTVDRLSASAPSDLREAIAGSRGRVLLVPWDYGPDCSPETWRGRALWVEPGTRGFFSGNLRPSSQWVQGVPTFDVGSPYNVPYPSARIFERYLRGGDALSADQLMTFYDSLPRFTHERVDRMTQRARQQAYRDAMLRLAEKHPEFLTHLPTAEMLRRARLQTAVSEYYARPSMVAGTWRFTISMPGHDTTIMYGRTQQFPNSLIGSPDGELHETELDGKPPFGYYLHMALASTEAELEVDGWPRGHRQGYLSASFEPETTTRDSTVWAGGVELFGAHDALPDSSTFRRLFPSLRGAGSIGMRADRPRYIPGRIIIKSGGSTRLKFLFPHGYDLSPQISGERISNIVWTPK